MHCKLVAVGAEPTLLLPNLEKGYFSAARAF